MPQLELHDVPFAALRLGDDLLLDVVSSVAALPSLGVLADLLDLADREPDGSPGLTALHDTRGTPFFAGTMRELAAAGPVSVIADPDPAATLSQLRDLDSRDVLFACHGKFDIDNPADSSLQLGPGGLSLSDIWSGLALSKARCVRARRVRERHDPGADRKRVRGLRRRVLLGRCARRRRQPVGGQPAGHGGAAGRLPGPDRSRRGRARRALGGAAGAAADDARRPHPVDRGLPARTAAHPDRGDRGDAGLPLRASRRTGRVFSPRAAKTKGRERSTGGRRRGRAAPPSGARPPARRRCRGRRRRTRDGPGRTRPCGPRPPRSARTRAARPARS